MRFLLTLILTLTVTTALNADALYLRNGRKVEGKIRSQANNLIRIETRKGMRVFHKRQVRKLTYYKVDLTSKKTRRRRRYRRRSRNQKKKTLSYEERWKLTWRSAVVPGWAQWKAGRKQKALIFGGASAFGGLLLYSSYRRWNVAQQDLNDLLDPYAGNGLYLSIGGLSPVLLSQALRDPGAAWAYNQPFETRRLEVRERFQTMQRYSLLLLGLYLWNLTDAWLDAGEQPARRGTIRLRPQLGLENTDLSEQFPNRNGLTAALVLEIKI